MKNTFLSIFFLLFLGSLDYSNAAFVKAETDDDKITTLTISFKKEKDFKPNEIDKEYERDKQSFIFAKAVYYDDGQFRKVTSKELREQIARQVRLRLAGLSDLPNVQLGQNKASSIEICFIDISLANHLSIITECINELKDEKVKKINITTFPILKDGYSLTNYQGIDQGTVIKAEESLKAFKDARKNKLGTHDRKKQEERETRTYHHNQFVKDNYPKSNVHKGY